MKKMQSIRNGFEYDLSDTQIEFIAKEMAKNGYSIYKYHPSIQGVRYGILSVDLPNKGYFSQLGLWGYGAMGANFKNLLKIAKKSKTVLSISNGYPYDASPIRPQFLFTPQSHNE